MDANPPEPCGLDASPATDQSRSAAGLVEMTLQGTVTLVTSSSPKASEEEGEACPASGRASGTLALQFWANPCPVPSHLRTEQGSPLTARWE